MVSTITLVRPASVPPLAAALHGAQSRFEVGEHLSSFGHQALGCGLPRYLTVDHDARGLHIECHSRSFGARLYALPLSSARDPRNELAGVSFDELDDSLERFDDAPFAHPLARWIRTGFKFICLDARDGVVARLDGSMGRVPVRTPTLVWIPGGYCYALQPPDPPPRLPTSPRQTPSISTATPHLALRGDASGVCGLLASRRRGGVAWVTDAEGVVLAGERPTRTIPAEPGERSWFLGEHDGVWGAFARLDVSLARRGVHRWFYPLLEDEGRDLDRVAPLLRLAMDRDAISFQPSAWPGRRPSTTPSQRAPQHAFDALAALLRESPAPTMANWWRESFRALHATGDPAAVGLLAFLATLLFEQKLFPARAASADLQLACCLAMEDRPGSPDGRGHRAESDLVKPFWWEVALDTLVGPAKDLSSLARAPEQALLNARTTGTIRAVERASTLFAALVESPAPLPSWGPRATLLHERRWAGFKPSNGPRDAKVRGLLEASERLRPLWGTARALEIASWIEGRGDADAKLVTLLRGE